jgi:hypothetical protein
LSDTKDPNKPKLRPVKREKVINLKVSQSEWERLGEEAAKEELDRSAYIRKKLFQSTPEENLAKALTQFKADQVPTDWLMQMIHAVLVNHKLLERASENDPDFNATFNAVTAEVEKEFTFPRPPKKSGE